MTKAPPSEILDRQPPADLAAERAVLGSILLNPDVLDELDGLRAEHFYLDAHRRLFLAFLHLRDRRVALDVVTLTSYLKESDQIKEVGGVVALAEIVQAVPHVYNASYYASLIRAAWTRREVILSCTDTLRAAWDVTKDIQATVSAHESRLTRIEFGESDDAPKPVNELIHVALERIDEIMATKRGCGVMTGFPEFDEKVGGLFPGQLHVLAARPSMGKTALATNIAEHVASRGKLVYFASLEMANLDLLFRMLCGRSGVQNHFVRSGRLEGDASHRLGEAARQIGQLPIAIHDRPRLSVSDIRRATRRLVRDGLGLVIVDYLGKLTPENPRDDRYLQIGKMTSDLKALARELNVPVLLLCQLARAAEAVEPRLDHLRESGDIEQDADVVMLLYRKDRGQDAVLDVAKNRNGDTGAFTLYFDAARTRFYGNEPQPNDEPMPAVSEWNPNYFEG
jgi:replicative DNA helicase